MTELSNMLVYSEYVWWGILKVLNTHVNFNENEQALDLFLVQPYQLYAFYRLQVNLPIVLKLSLLKSPTAIVMYN